MKRLISLTVLLALAIPALAMACHVTEVNGTADCDGWALCATVYFSDSVYSGTLNYQIIITDDAGNEVNRITASEVVSRDQGTCGGLYTYCFDGLWDGDHYSANGFHVQMCANLNGSTAQTDIFDLSCTVDDSQASFGSVKALYR